MWKFGLRGEGPKNQSLTDSKTQGKKKKKLELRPQHTEVVRHMQALLPFSV